MTSGLAFADMSEQWERDTFKIGRSITASYSPASDSGDGDEATPRRQRASRNNSDETASDEQADPAPRRQRRSRGVRVASLGNSYVPSEQPKKSITGGGGINWLASSSCLDSGIRGVLAEVASRFGSVTVNSTCRSHAHNRNVGGAPRSKHLTGDAADFRVHGNVSAAAAFLRSQGGGFKHYGGGLFHIDNGPARSW